jgi:hypothetical protein
MTGKGGRMWIGRRSGEKAVQQTFGPASACYVRTDSTQQLVYLDVDTAMRQPVYPDAATAMQQLAYQNRDGTTAGTYQNCNGSLVAEPEGTRGFGFYAMHMQRRSYYLTLLHKTWTWRVTFTYMNLHLNRVREGGVGPLLDILNFYLPLLG